MSDTQYHPSLLAAVKRHQEFFQGKRSYLIKMSVNLLESTEGDLRVKQKHQEMLKRFVPDVPYDGLDWNREFGNYYRSAVHNAKVRAEFRLDLGLGDDYIPGYYPYFGTAIHHAMFGGKVEFGGGTSCCHPVIEEACEWENLHFSMQNEWMQRLGEAMTYCRDHGDGVLLATLRGTNGPMDTANGVMGNQLFLDILLDPENTEQVMRISTEACDAMYSFQQECASEICGGFVIPTGGVWMPKPMFGHIAVDASLLTGPAIYNEFEKKWIEKLAEKYQGFQLHTHMMGLHMHKDYAATKGIQLICPADDPKQPTVREKLDELLDSVGDIPLMVSVEKDDIQKLVPKFKGKRCILNLFANSRRDALEQMEQVHALLDV